MLLKKKCFALVSLFAVLAIIACSKEESVVLARVDESGYAYSPTSVGGSVEYLPTMIPEKVRIVTLDDSLEPVDSIEVEVDSSYVDVAWGFNTGMREFEYPMLKMVSVFPGDKKKKMEFPQYMRLGRLSGSMKLHLYGALIFERVRNLMLKEKMKFDEADKKAKEELEKALGLSLYDINYREFKMAPESWEDPGLYDLLPYVLCHHEISDSVFYSEFKSLRKSFAENGKISSSIKVRAADVWLSTFRMPKDSSEKNIFRSYTRDSLVGLDFLDTAFFNDVYGLNANWRNKDSIKIECSSSDFNGRKFVRDVIRSGPYNSGWRLKTSLEDSIGTCLYEWSDYVERDGIGYLCRYDSFVWEKDGNLDSLMNYKYSRCEKNSSGNGMIGVYKDVFYACTCESSGSCGWNKVKKDFKADVLDSFSINVLATLRYGECKGHYGEKGELDSLLVMCSWEYKWVEVDSVVYNLGDCPKTNEDRYGQMPNGDYYKCKAYSGTWSPCTPIDAAKIPCVRFQNNDRTYKEYEGKYYYCENDKWKEVTEDEYTRNN